MIRPLVAIVGRPNVGKSTLFNRLVGERKALVHNEPGVTRDRHYGRGEAYGKPFDIVDTGGFDPDSTDQLLSAMREQARVAVSTADVILFVVDGRVGMTPTDEVVYAELRVCKQPLFVTVNKLDTERLKINAMEFHALGVDKVYPVSAEHGTGLGDLVEAISDVLPKPPEEDEVRSDRIRLAIVGRPNAGKSTLVNRLLGQARLITSDIPGTTRDSIDTDLDIPIEEVAVASSGAEPYVAGPELVEDSAFDDIDFGPDSDGGAGAPDEWADELPVDSETDQDDPEDESEEDEGIEPEPELVGPQFRKYTIIDTAGIRRRTHIEWAVEKFGVIKAMQSIDRAHIVVLLVDATEGLTDQDARIATRAVESGRGLIIALNKWDIVEKDGKTADQMAKAIRESRVSLAFAPIVFLSALTGQRTSKILELTDAVSASWRRRVPTSELNRWFEQTLRERPPPLHKRRNVRLYYVTQARSRPPTFVLQSNMPPDAFPVFYLRMLENRLRRHFGFDGTPLRFVVRQRVSQFKDRQVKAEPTKMSSRSRPTNSRSNSHSKK